MLLNFSFIRKELSEIGDGAGLNMEFAGQLIL